MFRISRRNLFVREPSALELGSSPIYSSLISVCRATFAVLINSSSSDAWYVAWQFVLDDHVFNIAGVPYLIPDCCGSCPMSVLYHSPQHQVPWYRTMIRTNRQPSFTSINSSRRYESVYFSKLKQHDRPICSLSLKISSGLSWSPSQRVTFRKSRVPGIRLPT